MRKGPPRRRNADDKAPERRAFAGAFFWRGDAPVGDWQPCGGSRQDACAVLATRASLPSDFPYQLKHWPMIELLNNLLQSVNK